MRKTQRERWLGWLRDQQKWIENCERNGRSYTGPNGQAIREADEGELKRIENECRDRGYLYTGTVRP